MRVQAIYARKDSLRRQWRTEKGGGIDGDKAWSEEGGRIPGGVRHLPNRGGAHALPERWDDSPRARVAQNGRNPNQEAFEGAFGLYYVDREIISLRCPGSEQLTVCSGRAVKNVGRTFYHWDCVIMTVRQHATVRPNDLPRLMQHLLEDEEQLFVAFEADDEYHYFLCEKRDLVLEKPKPQSRKEERAPANPRVNAAKVVSKLKN